MDGDWMKALIRNEGETITEDMNIPCIEWSNGYPLTGEKWFGGPYTLVQNYVPPKDDEPAQYEEVLVEPAQVEVEEEIENEDDYVIIDGKKYSKEELRALL